MSLADAFLPQASDLAYLNPRGTGRNEPRAGGLPLTTAVQPGLRGGYPNDPRGSEPSGDAGEGTDLPTVFTKIGRGEGATYQPHPYLPAAQQLDYAQKLTSTTLLLLGLTLMLIYFARSPRRAAKTVARGAARRAGAG